MPDQFCKVEDDKFIFEKLPSNLSFLLLFRGLDHVAKLLSQGRQLHLMFLQIPIALLVYRPHSDPPHKS